MLLEFYTRKNAFASWDAGVKCLVTAFFLHAIPDVCGGTITAGTLHGQMWQVTMSGTFAPNQPRRQK
jgi:hypothetical protein